MKTKPISHTHHCTGKAAIGYVMIVLTQPPRLCSCKRNLGGFSLAKRVCTW